ncbi:MAG TPA: ABC transporter permease [Opitutaceae bacterium]
MLSDLRFAFRSLHQAPGFALTSIFTLALGIGATTAIFSVLYAVLLRPFPYPESEHLVLLWQKGPQMEMSISWPTTQDWVREQRTFSALAVHRRDRFNLSDPGQLPENITGAYASPDLFAVGGLAPLRGRYFSAEENTPGAPPVAVISETLWERRFGRRENIVGELIPVDGVKRTVVGIAPAGLKLPRLAELWVPIAPYAAMQEGWQSRGNNPGLYSTGRLKPGVSLEQAAADLERIYTGLRQAHPNDLGGVSAKLTAFQEYQTRDYRTGLWALLGATFFVLAIACANVAGLFITRGMQQQRDYAVRSALGASRGRLIAQMLLQSLLVSLAGGALALVIAHAGLDAIRAVVPENTSRFQEIAVNGWVLAFAVAIAVGAGVLAGLWPALKLARADVRSALHANSRGTTSGTRARRWLVGVQVALTLVLLSTSGLILRSLQRMQDAPLGFDPSSTLTFSISLPQTRYNDTQARDFFLRAAERVATLPGVVSAAVNTTPVLDTGWQSSFAVEGIHQPDETNKPLAEMGIVSDDYFKTLHVPLLKGRAFDAREAAGPKAVIVDEAFVKRFFPNDDPLGKRVHWGYSTKPEDNWFTIVGVVPTLRVYGYGEEPVRPQAYWSLRQFGWTQKTMLVRTASSPRTLERPLRELFTGLDPEIALFGLSTLQEEVESTYENTTLQSLLLTIFAGLALLLALTGLYSVVAYGVALRRREIGVRMALGALGRDVVALMLRQGLVPLGVGLLAGAAGTLLAVRAIASQLYQVSPYDPWTLLVTAALLIAAATFACWWPARRAVRINPVEALRSE